MEEQRPKVGIGVMIFKDGKILLHTRKNAHGAGELAFPGGHLEYMESITDCAIRETREEAGIEITNIRFLLLANLKAYTPKHYVHINMIADWKSGEPKIMEPEKNAGWGWYDIDALPKNQPVFQIINECITAYKTGRNFFDA